VNEFSIIIPVLNEEKNIIKLVKEIFYTLEDYHNFELIIVNDGSKDNTLENLKSLKIEFPIKIINNINNYGQSYSINEGIKQSNYNTIVTIDGDGQNNPVDIPKLLDVYFANEDIQLVGGIRKNRKDNFIKLISSKVANKVRSKILQDDCTDTGCSLKVFDKKVFLKFPFFHGIHRFLPALFKSFGNKTSFIDVDHRPRLQGISKYGILERLFKGLIDLIRVVIITKKYKKNRG
jgi:dolichol-phosphate mannosyltransferase|tara:strand:- start:1064 stop:1765 length:702 start_codon:yes stop_codon:yes gene_type:complete